MFLNLCFRVLSSFFVKARFGVIELSFYNTREVVFFTLCLSYCFLSIVLLSPYLKFKPYFPMTLMPHPTMQLLFGYIRIPLNIFVLHGVCEDLASPLCLCYFFCVTRVANFLKYCGLVMQKLCTVIHVWPRSPIPIILMKWRVSFTLYRCENMSVQLCHSLPSLPSPCHMLCVLPGE